MTWHVYRAAVCDGNADALRLLLLPGAKADPDEADSDDGTTSVHFGHADELQLLLGAKADTSTAYVHTYSSTYL